MKQLIYILIIISFFSCSEKGKTNTPKNIDKVSTKILFPVKAKHTSGFEEDTLITQIDKIDFTITPTGKILWGQNNSNTFQLDTDLIVEESYLFKSRDTLFIFYTETDHEGATSRLEKINLLTKKRILTAEIQGFNLGLPHIKDNFAYVTTIGVVGKLNLKNGKYKYQYFGLYDDKKYSFNSFDTIIFKDNLTMFLSKNYHSKRIDSIIVNEKLGTTIIKK